MATIGRTAGGANDPHWAPRERLRPLLTYSLIEVLKLNYALGGMQLASP
jgi:hypothetical protein